MTVDPAFGPNEGIRVGVSKVRLPCAVFIGLVDLHRVTQRQERHVLLRIRDDGERLALRTALRHAPAVRIRIAGRDQNVGRRIEFDPHRRDRSARQERRHPHAEAVLVLTDAQTEIRQTDEPVEVRVVIPIAPAVLVTLAVSVAHGRQEDAVLRTAVVHRHGEQAHLLLARTVHATDHPCLAEARQLFCILDIRRVIAPARPSVNALLARQQLHDVPRLDTTDLRRDVRHADRFDPKRLASARRQIAAVVRKRDARRRIVSAESVREVFCERSLLVRARPASVKRKTPEDLEREIRAVGELAGHENRWLVQASLVVVERDVPEAGLACGHGADPEILAYDIHVRALVEDDPQLGVVVIVNTNDLQHHLLNGIRRDRPSRRNGGCLRRTLLLRLQLLATLLRREPRQNIAFILIIKSFYAIIHHAAARQRNDCHDRGNGHQPPKHALFHMCAYYNRNIRSVRTSIAVFWARSVKTALAVLTDRVLLELCE